MARFRAKRAPRENPALAGTLLVPLTRGYFAIIDAADGPAVAEHIWAAFTPGPRAVYAKADIVIDGRRRGVQLHRFLWQRWGLESAPEIDHRNTNGLDCRRENLRAATRAQNASNCRRHITNTSGFKGVSWNAHARKWTAQIKSGGTYRYLGVFTDPKEASKAYQAAAAELHGEFARAS